MVQRTDFQPPSCRALISRFMSPNRAGVVACTRTQLLVDMDCHAASAWSVQEPGQMIKLCQTRYQWLRFQYWTGDNRQPADNLLTSALLHVDLTLHVATTGWCDTLYMHNSLLTETLPV